MYPAWIHLLLAQMCDNAQDVRAYGISLRIAPFRRKVRWRQVHDRQRKRLVRSRLNQDQQDGQCRSRSVFLGTQADATTTLVQGCTTYAKVVGVMNPCTAAGIVPDSIVEVSHPSMLQHQILCQEGVNQRDPKLQDQTPQVTTRLNKAAWARGLLNHPDEQFSTDILNFIEFGAPLMFEGPHFEPDIL